MAVSRLPTNSQPATFGSLVGKAILQGSATAG